MIEGKKGVREYSGFWVVKIRTLVKNRWISMTGSKLNPKTV